MIVNEAPMRTGTFTLTLRGRGPAGTPGHILAALRDALGWNPDGTWSTSDGHIVVTDTPLELGALVGTLAPSVYTGRLGKQTGVRTFTGHGLDVWMGAPNKPGPVRTTRTEYAAQDLEDWVDDLRSNDLTKGTVTEPGGTVAETWHGVTAAEMLFRVCTRFGAEYRINPDGSVDAGTISALYGDADAVVLRDPSPIGASPFDSSTSLRGLRGSALSPTIDVEQRTGFTVVYGEGNVVESASASGDVWLTIAGNGAELDRLVEAPDQDDAGAAAIATSVQNLWEDGRFDFDVAIVEARAYPYIQRGAFLWVYDPEAGILDTSNPLNFQGRDIFPVLCRIESINHAFTYGHGVYLVTDTGVTNLTPFVEWPRPGTKLKVNSNLGALDRATGLTARY